MKHFGLKISAITVVGGVLGGLISSTQSEADLPDPSLGECEIADAVIHRTAPTMLDGDGNVTGMRVWLVCAYQYPGSTGAIVNRDGTFVLEVDADTAQQIVDGAGELVDGQVYTAP